MSFLSNPKLLPTFIVVLNVLASLGYLAHRDIRHAIYWGASAVLIAAVTY